MYTINADDPNTLPSGSPVVIYLAVDNTYSGLFFAIGDLNTKKTIHEKFPAWHPGGCTNKHFFYESSNIQKIAVKNSSAFRLLFQKLQWF